MALAVLGVGLSGGPVVIGRTRLAIGKFRAWLAARGQS